MRVAWLRPGSVSTPPDPLDATAGVIAELRAEHDIEAIDARGVHDLVWRQARQPFDLLVHELDDSPAHAFIPPYAMHFPGVLLLRRFATHHPRAIAASRLVVVGDPAVASSLQEKYPDTPVIAAPEGVGTPAAAPPSPGGAHGASGPYRFGVLDGRRQDVVSRAAERARQAGARLEIIGGAADAVLRDADVIVALDWPPPSGPPVPALAAMAAGKPAIVLETLATAGWPALDPQTWRPRGFGPAHARAAPPIAISIDPRDEEHSLMLAMKRLTADPSLGAGLGAAGHAWWSGHATIAHAAAAWRRILNEPGPPPRPFAGADGSEHAREVLAAFGVQVDFL